MQPISICRFSRPVGAATRETVLRPWPVMGQAVLMQDGSGFPDRFSIGRSSDPNERPNSRTLQHNFNIGTNMAVPIEMRSFRELVH